MISRISKCANCVVLTATPTTTSTTSSGAVQQLRLPGLPPKSKWSNRRRLQFSSSFYSFLVPAVAAAAAAVDWPDRSADSKSNSARWWNSLHYATYSGITNKHSTPHSNTHECILRVIILNQTNPIVGPSSNNSINNNTKQTQIRRKTVNSRVSLKATFAFPRSARDQPSLKN